MVFFSTLLLSMFITLGLIPIFSRIAVKLQILDIPNHRTIHLSPIPRVGGMAMAIGVLLSFFLQNFIDKSYLAILIGTIIIVAFGMLDDIFGLSYKIKFIAQILAALVLIVYGNICIQNLGTCLPDGAVIPDWISYPLTLLVIVAVTNAVNLADGLDGLAGGIMLLVFFSLCFLGIQSEIVFVTLVCLGVIGSILGFLRYNTYPAQIFMGDTGSQMLGFLAIALLLLITQNNGALSPLLPLLLVGFPVLDTGVVMVTRIIRGKPPFKPDKSHFHHKLLDIGFFHNEAVFLFYAIQTVFVLAAYVLRYYDERTILACFLLLVFLLMGPVYFASSRKVVLSRKSMMDTSVKPFLRLQIKDRAFFLRILQPALTYGIPIIYLFTTFLPSKIPIELGLVAFFLLGALSADLWFRSKYIATVMRVSTYLVMPLIIYQTLQQTSLWFGPISAKVFVIILTLLALTTIMLLRLTRRRQGFRPTPTDYLIVLFAIILLTLPQQQFVNDEIGFWGTFLILFFFSSEVLLGELRGDFRRLGFSFLPSMLVLFARGIQSLLF